MSRVIDIADRRIGPGHDVFVIAEIAQAHDGSLGNAHAYVDAVADAGADAIKFQTHIAEAESTPDEPWRVKFSKQDATRFEYWQRMEFTEDQWHGLAAHAKERGIVFLSSAFSFEAVELLERVGMPAWKLGSGEISNLPMIRQMAATGKPLLISSGMSHWDELDAAVRCAEGAGADVAVFQCTTSYPVEPARWGLNVIGDMKARYSGPVGYSDHSATVAAGLGAVALGADLLEVHVVFSKHCFGPDTSSSLTIDELRALKEGATALRTAVQHPVDKDAMADSLGDLHNIFTKSVVARHDLSEGTVLGAGDLSLKKPGTGIPAARWDDVVGKTLRRNVKKNGQIQEQDLG